MPPGIVSNNSLHVRYPVEYELARNTIFGAPVKSLSKSITCDIPDEIKLSVRFLYNSGAPVKSLSKSTCDFPDEIKLSVRVLYNSGAPVTFLPKSTTCYCPDKIKHSVRILSNSGAPVKPLLLEDS